MSTDFLSVIQTELESAQYLYRVELEDFSRPPFSSGTKPYFGTCHDIHNFNAFLASVPGFKLDGPLLRTRMEILGIRTSTNSNFQHQHLNVWGWPYEIHCDLVESIHVWLRHKNSFYRCLKSRLVGASYYCDASDSLHPLGTMIWGHPGVLEYSNSTLYNRLFEIENIFSSEEELRDDMSAFDGKPVLAEFLNDIFGDG